ncbi:actin binding protein anillin [Echinococcus multilocularis]|uniref:Actin binding protein anillin n=1 Tax=Echinococcus multilocularis TaxID=6211 RepID=A0A0S4MN56_ECHMU|nr:actin binding protein anillin [Echinococcus multilocularis]
MLEKCWVNIRHLYGKAVTFIPPQGFFLPKIKVQMGLKDCEAVRNALKSCLTLTSSRIRAHGFVAVTSALCHLQTKARLLRGYSFIFNDPGEWYSHIPAVDPLHLLRPDFVISIEVYCLQTGSSGGVGIDGASTDSYQCLGLQTLVWRSISIVVMEKSLIISSAKKCEEEEVQRSTSKGGYRSVC